MIVSGHGLQDEGAAFTSRACTDDVCRRTPTVRRVQPTTIGGAGHGLCACGAMSTHLDSGGERQRWHREQHKAELAKAASAAKPKHRR